MRNKGRVAIAMSGGVDSSVAAALLRKAGWEVIGVTLRLWEEEQADLTAAARGCCAWEAVQDARRAAQSLGIDHYVLNMKELFRKEVVADFISEYRTGRTPNPCIVCNSRVKFSALLQKALEMEASNLATGHYARLAYGDAGGRILLKKGLDSWKDQSYMLYNLTQEQLRRCLFPLGAMTKEQVRHKAASLGLDVARKPDSQEICFIPDNDYRSFLRRCGVPAEPGPIVDRRGDRLGTHTGLAFYTIGQRRGLGLTAPKPLYVLEIRTRDNTLVVGEREELFREGAEIEEVNLIAFPELDRVHRVSVKIRYRTAAVPAILKPLPGNGMARVVFEQPQAAVTPGQAAVFYQEDLVIGGGIIKEAL
ncbi:MAG: tRNA 2-thiouridine(34) synthase MnmA [Bacillota bacterium]